MTTRIPSTVALEPFDAARVWRWYTTRLTSGGPEVACELQLAGERCPETGELLEDERLIVVVDGEARQSRTGIVRGWPWKPTDEMTCRYLTELSAWAKAHAPDHPLAAPATPIRRDLAPCF